MYKVVGTASPNDILLAWSKSPFFPQPSTVRPGSLQWVVVAQVASKGPTPTVQTSKPQLNQQPHVPTPFYGTLEFLEVPTELGTVYDSLFLFTGSSQAT